MNSTAQLAAALHSARECRSRAIRGRTAGRWLSVAWDMAELHRRTALLDDLALVQGRSDNDTDDNDLLASPGLAYGQEALAGTK
jgi:hypothetical protein